MQRETTLSVGEAPPRTFDLDDMFGIRRALGALPPDRWDEFFAAWVEVAQACDLDIEQMQVLAALGASSPNGAAADRHLLRAWRTVSDAMASYLLWRSQRNGGHGC